MHKMGYLALKVLSATLHTGFSYQQNKKKEEANYKNYLISQLFTIKTLKLQLVYNISFSLVES